LRRKRVCIGSEQVGVGGDCPDCLCAVDQDKCVDLPRSPGGTCDVHLRPSCPGDMRKGDQAGPWTCKRCDTLLEGLASGLELHGPNPHPTPSGKHRERDGEPWMLQVRRDRLIPLAPIQTPDCLTDPTSRRP
jgi:hypothetical protein